MATDHATYEILMLKKIEGRLSKDEHEKLDAWMQASTDRMAQFEQMQALWQLTEPDHVPLEPDYETGWDNVSARIRKRAADRPAARSTRRSYARWGRLVVPLVLLIALIWYLQPSSVLQVQEVARGETAKIELADQSVVQLNSGSRLTYPEVFDSGERRVILEGEAFFEVESGDAPFIVESTQAMVTVLGTRFNVNTRHNETRVTVQEGRVRLSANGSSEVIVELQESEGAVLRQTNQIDSIEPSQVTDTFGWMEGMLSFHQTPLWQIVEEVERTFDQDISLDPSKANQLIGGSIRVDSLHQTLETICLLASCSISSEAGTIVLK